MTGIVCSMVGASFAVAAAAQIIRYKKGISAVGNAQIDTAQSKFGGASALFDGTGDALIVENNSSFAYGTNDFTIEFWLRRNTTGTGAIIFDQRPTGTLGTQPCLYFVSDGTLYYYTNAGNRITGPVLTNNIWYHIALSRSGTSTKLFVDGTQVGSTYTDSTNYTAPSTLKIGGDQYDTNGGHFNGWIDEFRISNTARYTSNFTPATTPFVNDNNTLLLLHMDGTDATTYFEDDNGVRAKKGIQAGNNAQIDTAQSKFGGASALFDATSDYLIVQPNSDLAFGTSDFTIEFWIRFTSTSSSIIYDHRPTSTDGNYPTIYWASSTIIYYVASQNRITSNSLSLNTWYHIAVSRSGTSTKLFVDGTQSGSTYTDLVNYIVGSNRPVIGTAGDGNLSTTNSVNGWIDELRVSNSARYTGTFTPSTTPFVNDANTLLLLHMDGTDGSTVFRDDNGTGRANRSIVANGNAQIDTAQSKFGGASALFDGTDDYLGVYPATNFGTNNFTIELWFRTSAKTQLYPCIINNYVGGSFTTNSWSLFDRHDAVNTKLTLYAYNINSSNPILTSTTSISNGVWYHVAIVRSGTSIKMYLNGTEESSTTSSGSLDGSADKNIFIGKADITTQTSYNGWVDEVRISNTARYTSNFTPPTTPFQNDSNTLLLMHMDGTDASTVFIDDNGKIPVTP